ncbi:Acetate kinase [Caprobacter fermentans]|uniref:Acetate kinase n=1 Tax=Caproicibacter fermentans TaxID=2576756 RepID=A0A6N8I2U9_9FIRM|nr:acetate kinase [Caproicibacter fermentans]MVB11863.1 Acetate kinase [Caproicibacter fermentans]OCM99896.1 acetate kinase [Clostridium sp. W14A]QNK41101.1 acetate kinase [Caproicibacter fermentans]
MKVLVINAGSSSLKYQLIDMETEKMLAKGLCDRIGVDGAFQHKTSDGRSKKTKTEIKDHEAAFQLVTEALVDKEVGVISSLNEISAIGHRVVQGGAIFDKSVLVTDEVIRQIQNLIPLAPLHNGPEVNAILACQKVFGKDEPQCVVFDTSFHATMPQKAYMYAIPYEYYEKYNVRRYGFHGTSHRYVSNHCAHLMHQPLEDIKMITCHIGNGSSIAAIQNGKVIDTSMGLTPLDGFMMGTRSGSLDPSIVTFIMEKEGLTPKQMDEILNRKSGMYGICGYSDDRDVTKAEIGGDPKAILAHEMLNYQIAKQIGAYAAALNGVDCIVFTAGLGENQPPMRYSICKSLKYLGVKIDPIKNDELVLGKEGKISAFDSTVSVYVINTNEELVIARDTKNIVSRLEYASAPDKTNVDPEDV